MGRKAPDRLASALFVRARHGDSEAADELRQLLQAPSTTRGALRVLCGLSVTPANRPTIGAVLDGALTEDDLRAYQRSLGNQTKIARVDDVLGALLTHQERAKTDRHLIAMPSEGASEPARDLGPLIELLSGLADGRIILDQDSRLSTVPSITMSCRSATFDILSTGNGSWSVHCRLPVPGVTRLEKAGWRRSGNRLTRRWRQDSPERVARDLSDALRAMFSSPRNPKLRIGDKLISEWLVDHVINLNEDRADDSDFEGAEDRVLGSMGSTSDLRTWMDQVRPASFRQRSLRVPPTPAAGSDEIGWCRTFTRLNPTDAARLKAALATAALVHHNQRLATTELSRLILEASLVLVPARDAYDLFTSEDLPRQWMRDIRLPFPVTTLCFSSPFQIPRSWARSLPDGECPPAVWDYRQWFGQIATSGALLGVTLVADADGTVSTNGIAHCAVLDDDQCRQAVNVPSRLDQTSLEGIVRPLAGWLSQPHLLTDDAGVMVTRGSSAARKRTGPKTAVNAGPKNSTITLKPSSTSERRRPSGTHSTPSSHVRRGHWRRQRIGPRNDWHYEIRWVSPTWVTAGRAGEPPNHVYVLPPPVGSR